MTRVHLLLAVSAARIGWKSERQSSYQRTRDAFFGNCMEVTRVWTGWKEGDVLEERERERESASLTLSLRPISSFRPKNQKPFADLCELNPQTISYSEHLAEASFLFLAL